MAHDTPTAARRTDIRVDRKKDVADIARSVVQDKAEMHEIEASLHRVANRYERAAFAEREVFDQVLQAQLYLARALRRIAEENVELKRELAELKVLLRGGEVGISVGS